MDNSNRLPWIIAFSSLFFAVGVLLTVLLMRGQYPPQAVQVIDPGATVQRPVNDAVVTATPAEPVASPADGNRVVTGAGTPSNGVATPVSSSPSPGVAAVPTGYTISGSVTDLQGNGVPGATVQFSLDQRGSQVRVELAADADGHFESKNLVSSRVSGVVAEAPGYARSEPMPVFDLPMDGLEIALKRQTSAELRILDGRGDMENPVPYEGEATVYLLRQNDGAFTTATLEGDGGPGAAARFEAMATDTASIKGGSYPLKGIEPGTYKGAVVIRGDEYAESEKFEVDAEAGGSGTVVVGRRQTLVGFVKSDPEQEPLGGVSVSLTAVGRPAVVGIPRPYRTATLSDGRFELEGVITGDYRLTLSAAGYTTKTFDLIPVSSGPPPAPATFFMVRTEPKLKVEVYGPENLPFRNAPLVLISTGADVQARSWFGRTDQSGSHQFGPLPAGRYSLAVTAPDNRARQKMLDLVIDEKQELSTVEVRFTPTVDVRGKITRKGKALEGLLSFLPRGAVAPETFAKADKEGDFSEDLEPGEYMVGEARQEGRTILKVEPGDVQSADLDLP